MELMVSITILVIIILAVGVTFSGASQSVGISQATMEEMASIRAAQQLLETDLRGLDKNGFLVIRSRLLNTNTNPIPSSPAIRYIDISPHYDQLSFLSGGTFQNRSGADTNSPFTDSTTSSAAHVWWGQLIVEKSGANANPALAPLPSYMPPNQAAGCVQSQPPTGVYFNGSNLVVTSESDFILGRHATLLVPGPADSLNHVITAGQPVMAYPNIDAINAPTIKGNVEENGCWANIISSRYSLAAQSPAQVMQYVLKARAANVSNFPESDLLTYRFRTLASVYDTEVSVNPFVNGYFRTTPNVMAGVSSFRVEWTDGATYDNSDPLGRAGQLVWFGASNPNGNLPAGTEQIAGTPIPPSFADHYVATFSYFNKPYWPKALRITMHVANDRIGGRDFVQVINLP